MSWPLRWCKRQQSPFGLEKTSSSNACIATVMLHTLLVGYFRTYRSHLTPSLGWSLQICWWTLSPETRLNGLHFYRRLSILFGVVSCESWQKSWKIACEKDTLREFTVILGQRICHQGRCDFLLVVNSNLGWFSRFRSYGDLLAKIASTTCPCLI